MVAYLLSRYFDLPALSTLFGTAWLAFGLAGAVGPIAMGRAHDATGSYEVVLVYMAVGTLAIAALILSLPPPTIGVLGRKLPNRDDRGRRRDGP